MFEGRFWNCLVGCALFWANEMDGLELGDDDNKMSKRVPLIHVANGDKGDKSRCRFAFLTSYPLSPNPPPPTLLFGLLRLDSLSQQSSSNRTRQKQMNKAITRLLQRTSLFFFFFFFFLFFWKPKKTANKKLTPTTSTPPSSPKDNPGPNFALRSVSEGLPRSRRGCR